MKTLRIWEILKKFKENCRFRGWKTSENEDWVEVDSKYHNFLLTRNIHPSSFRNIALNRKCVVREGLTYRVVEASYMAWVFSETPPENLINLFLENPDFSKKVALYDLSSIAEGRNTCVKLNFTDSPVFQAFENFLEREFGVKIEEYTNLKSSLEDCTLTEAI
ncbi:MAG: hypothetical protein ACP5JW_03900 [Candidatus Bathyarchaeia archaeon]